MRHFETKHGDLKHKLSEYFQRKLSDLSASKGQIMLFSGVNMKAVVASYKVSFKIVKARNPYTFWEFLPLKAAKDTANSVLGEKVTKQLGWIPLSNDTVSRRISDMASNVKEQLIEKVEATK
jgi:ribosomal protein L10